MDRTAAPFWCSSVGLVVMLLAIAVPTSVEADDHIVGANKGWQLPANAGGNLNYTVWAASQTFLLGDYISFRYPRDLYTVFQVNFSVYTNCTINMYYGHDWIYNWTNKAGRILILLNQTMVYYFVDANHCRDGMKVAVNVTRNSTEATSSSSSSSSTSSSSSKNKNSNASAAPLPESATTLTSLILVEVLLLFTVWLLYPTL